MTNNKYFLSTITLLSFTLLSGCGGGGASGTTNTINHTPSQPHQLSARELQEVDALSSPSPIVIADAKTITITYFGSDLVPDEHNQFYLNIDNNTATGYQFAGEAWDNAGADYIVEDGYLLA